MSFHYKYFVLSVLMLFALFSCNKEENTSPQAKTPEVKKIPERIINLSTIANVSGYEDIVDAVKKAYEKIGFKVKIHEMPAQRSLHESNSGEAIDGELARAVFAEQFMKTQIRVPVRLTTIEASVFVKDLDIEIKGWESIKGYRTTSVRGYMILKKHMENLSQLTEVADTKQALSFLDNNRADLAVLVKKIGLKTLESLNFKDIKVLEPAIEHIPVYHYIHEKNKDLLPAITKALSEVTGNAIEKD